MNRSQKKILSFIIIALAAMVVQACGQKGPLEVERPQVQQEKELEDTK